MGNHHPAAKQSCTQKQGLRSPAFLAGFFFAYARMARRLSQRIKPPRTGSFS